MENGEWRILDRVIMNDSNRDIHGRLKRYAINAVKLAGDLPRVPGVYRIADQIVGAGTSPAANAREADQARSPQEFISCMGIALKELGEARLWLEIIQELKWVDEQRTLALLQETDELFRILSTIILNAKENRSKIKL